MLIGRILSDVKAACAMTFNGLGSTLMVQYDMAVIVGQTRGALWLIGPDTSDMW